MEIKEYKKAVSEIKASEEKKEAIIGTLVAQTSSTSKEVKHVFTKNMLLWLLLRLFSFAL